MKTSVRLFALLTALFAQTAGAQDIFANRPAFSPAEAPAASPGRCDQIRAMAEGLGQPDFRIDLALDGDRAAIRAATVARAIALALEVLGGNVPGAGTNAAVR